MKKTLLTGIAALLLATGTAHAIERLPEAMLGELVTGTSKSLLVYLPRGVTVATGNLEQYSLSAISALAERAVAALVPG